jgi:hypothetical protein
VTTCGDVGTGSVPVTLCGLGVVVSACAIVPESAPRTTASTSRRVSDLYKGSLLFSASCAARRLGISEGETDDLLSLVLLMTQNHAANLIGVY